jgi:hypothetical protein
VSCPAHVFGWTAFSSIEGFAYPHRKAALMPPTSLEQRVFGNVHGS